VRFLRETVYALRKSDRLDKSRACAASRGMWAMVHSGFFFEPRFWATTLKETQALFPGTYPDVPLYRSRYGRMVPPLLLESVMTPKRWFNHAVRAWKVKRGWHFSALPP
jgi:hypothetical protein